MATQPIDLSGGFVPKSAAPAGPSPTTSAQPIDLSGGLVQKPPQQPVQSSDERQPKLPLAPGTQTNNYQAVPEEATAEGNAQAIARRDAEDPIGAAVGHAATGFVNSGLQTLHTAAALGSRVVPGVKDVPFEQPKDLETHGAAESIGAGLENIVEFMGGDAALKGLSLATRLGIAQKVISLAEKSPLLAKALQYGMKAVHGAALGGAVGGVHGGKEGAEAGAVVGGVLEPATAAVGAGISKVKGLISGVGKEGAAVSPVEQKVGQALEESGVTQGRPETVAPAEHTLQPDLEQGIHRAAEKAATEEGVPYKKPASIRDAFDSAGREVVNKAKTDLRALDEASGGRWQRFDDAIKNIQRKMNDVVGVDDDAYEALELKRNEIQTQQAQVIEDMKAAGTIDPDVADKAFAQYRRGMALHDVGSAVKGATKPTSVNNSIIDITEPNSLAARLAKLNDVPPAGGTPRLQQALGKQGAKDFLTHADAAQIAKQAIQDFVPESATGQEALEKLIRESTSVKGGVGSPKATIDWAKVRNAFETLKPEEQDKAFGQDTEKLRMYLNKQALKQSAIKVLKRTAIAVASGAAFGAGVKGVKHLGE